MLPTELESLDKKCSRRIHEAFVATKYSTIYIVALKKEIRP